MPVTALTGTRLRERRLALGLRQADLAGAVGISASYLNLIEHNRRRIAPDLLHRLAARLGVEVAALEEGAGGALAEELRDAAAELAGLGAEIERIEEFTGRFPGWAALLAAHHRRAATLARAVEALNDRLGQDPHLSAALHEMLSAVASVRSTAGILAEMPEIEPDWRARFLANLHQDSERLALGAEALVVYLDHQDGGEAAGGLGAPEEEVEAWLAARDWDLGALEAPAGAAALLAEVEASLAASASRARAAAFLAQAAEDARRLPGAALREALARDGVDPLRLAARLGVPALAVFRRLALLPGFEAGLVLCDASGAMTFRKPHPGFPLPRFGAACPLWPLYTALARPTTPVEALAETPAGRRFRVLAWCEVHHPDGFAGPELREAAMLILPAGPGGPAPAQAPVLRLGSTCRICPRTPCPARREPSILTARG